MPPGLSTLAASPSSCAVGRITTMPMLDVTASTDASANGSRRASALTQGPGDRRAASLSSASARSIPTTVRPARSSSRVIAPAPHARSSTSWARDDTARASQR